MEYNLYLNYSFLVCPPFLPMKDYTFLLLQIMRYVNSSRSQNKITEPDTFVSDFTSNIISTTHLKSIEP